MGVVVLGSNLSTLKMEAGGLLGVPREAGLHCEFKAILNCTRRHCLKKARSLDVLDMLLWSNI